MVLPDHTLSLDMLNSALSELSCDALDDNAFAGNDIFEYRRAAVLVIIYGMQQKLQPQRPSQLLPALAAPIRTVPYPRPIVIMTVKSMRMNIHAGEISFPGGKVDAGDRDLLHTALRETREEIGIDLKRDQVIGRLCSVTTRNSGFVITPFVSIISERPDMTPNAEVEEILEMPLDELLCTAAPDVNPGHDATSDMYVFEHDATKGKPIWGASARILKQIHDILEIG